MAEVSKQRIAKNALFLYLRMGLTTLVSLYTSRVVLSVLGVEDFGTYGVVGGIVTLFSFLNTAAGGSTVRFMTFEMGKGAAGRLKETFSTSLIIHIFIALLIAVLASTIGLHFLWTELQIPSGRMEAATYVLLCSVLGMAVSVTQEPYNAALVAHEHFDVYAYVEILNVVLKLVIVFLLQIGPFDKLIFYAFLQLGVSVFIAMLYRLYCLRYFAECRFKWVWDTSLLRQMFSYSGWDLFGSLTHTACSQGVTFLINIFFGVVFNAASGVATAVEGVLNGLAFNILAAFRPQIIKQYSSGNPQSSADLIYMGARFSTLLLVLLAIPFSIEMNYIMELWLKTPPPYAATFCRIMLISGCLNMASCAAFYGINATGKMSAVSFFSGVKNLAQVLLLWLLFRLGAPVESAYLLVIPFTFGSVLLRGGLLQHYVRDFRCLSLIGKAYGPSLLIILITVALTLPVTHLLQEGFLRLCAVFACSLSVGVACSLLIAFNSAQRRALFAIIRSKLPA